MHPSLRVLLFTAALLVLPFVVPFAGGLPKLAIELKAHWREQVAATASEGSDAGAVEHAAAIVGELIERSMRQ